jgi:hypothetical protein
MIEALGRAFIAANFEHGISSDSNLLQRPHTLKPLMIQQLGESLSDRSISYENL